MFKIVEYYQNLDNTNINEEGLILKANVSSREEAYASATRFAEDVAKNLDELIAWNDTLVEVLGKARIDKNFDDRIIVNIPSYDEEYYAFVIEEEP